MTRYAMAIDTLTCIGCYACTLACKVENASPEGIWTAPVITKEIGSFPDVRRILLPLLCNHCADAPCLSACPTRAIARRDDGIVLIDTDRCCGSRACVIACPYGAIHYYAERNGLGTPFEEARVSRHPPGTAQKCTFCASRLDRGLSPACVDCCPTGARIFGDLDDAGSPVARALASYESVALAAPVATAPSVVYLTEGVRRAGGSASDLSLRSRPQRQWRMPHAAEFWLLGAGAGLYVASRWLDPGRLLFGLDLTALLAAAMVALAGLILIADLGRPRRFLGALGAWRTNWISRGAVADFLFLALVALSALPLPPAVRLPVTALALGLAVVVACYPALAMGSLQSVRAWRGRGLALEFLVEALMMGTALAGLLGGWRGRTAPALPVLGVLALLRIGLALWRRRQAGWPAAVGALGAAATGGLAALALPGSSTILGGGAVAAAVVTGFATKLASLRAGASPSPFTAAGEMGGSLRAGG